MTRRYNNGATSANKVYYLRLLVLSLKFMPVSSKALNFAEQAPEENVGSCSPQDSPVAKIIGSSSSSDNPSNQQSSGSDRAAQREAALIKFRLKRKERCFEKKVSYL